MKRYILLATALFALAACGPDQQRDDDSKEATDVAAALSGDAKGEAANNPLCRLFTPQEAAGYVGEPVGEPRNAMGGMGCQWMAQDGTGDMIVSALSSDFATSPTGSKGFRAQPDLGKDGFVAGELDGFTAGAVVGGDFVKVSVAGAGANPDRAIALFKTTVSRRR